MDRPSKKELFNKIREAKAAIAGDRIQIVEAEVIAADAIELGYDIESDLKEILQHLLETLSPEDYRGSRPPDRSYERKIQGLDLFAFVVGISCFDYPVYIKFALTQDTFWLVSLHRDRPHEEGI